jgi:hypothetical protein
MASAAAAAEDLRTKGYTIVQGAYTAEQLEKAKDATHSYFESHPSLANASGKFLPDFLGIEALAPMAALKDSPAVADAFEAYFGGVNAYRFCGHSDIGVNRVVSGWHKDILNGAFVSYQTVDPWATGPARELYQILKLGIYLEDHSTDSGALEVVPGSHLKRSLDTSGSVRLHPALGDAILFDQRITHRGLAAPVKSSRIMISFGFGANNLFTDNFEKGTKARQASQLRSIF